MLSRGTVRALARASRCDVNSTYVRSFTINCARRPTQSSCMRQANRLHQRRNISTITKIREFVKDEMRKSPVMMSIAIAGFAVTTVLIITLPYVALSSLFWPYHKFPEPVAEELRKAVYYHRRKDIERALKHYKHALGKAQVLGMDPVSDEVTGTKLAIGQLLEEHRFYEQAIDVNERVLKDCLDWLRDHAEEHYEDGQRTRLLGKSVAISMKLGELLASDLVLDIASAERHLVWGVETTMKERIRRQRDGVKEGEGDWLSDEEFGATMEQLALHYESKYLHYLSTPLLLQALALSPPKSCHTVVLMANIASCIAQSTPPPAVLPPKSFTVTKNTMSNVVPKKPSAMKQEKKKQDNQKDSFPETGHPEKKVLRAQATTWAKKALALEKSIKEGRTEECDQGCAAATHALGEFAAAEGRIEDAKQLYLDARRISVSVDFEEGLKQAKKGLVRLGMEKEETSDVERDTKKLSKKGWLDFLR